MLNTSMYKATIKTPIIIPITTIISGSIIIERHLTRVSNSFIHILYIYFGIKLFFIIVLIKEAVIASFVFFVTAKISVFLISTIQSCIF